MLLKSPVSSCCAIPTSFVLPNVTKSTAAPRPDKKGRVLGHPGELSRIGREDENQSEAGHSVVLLVIAGLTALDGRKAFRLHADASLHRRHLARRMWSGHHSPRLSISSLMATANSPAPPLRIRAARFFPGLHRNLFGQAELHRWSDRDLAIVDSGKEVELVSTDAGLVIFG